MAPVTRSLSAAIGPDTLVKVLRTNLTHHGYTYKLGLNVCTQLFNKLECEDGGLYGCRLKDLFKWVSLYPDIDTVAIVEIPKKAQVKWFDTKFKASSLLLHRFIPLTQALDLALQHGANIHANDDDALRRASWYGHFPVVQYLVEHGANIHAKDDQALRWAAGDGHLLIVKCLVEHGANIHANDDEALRGATECGSLLVVQYLVEHGANIHAIDDEAFRKASKFGHLPIVHYLFEHGANIHANDDEALRKAAENEHLHIVDYLKSTD